MNNSYGERDESKIFIISLNKNLAKLRGDKIASPWYNNKQDIPNLTDWSDCLWLRLHIMIVQNF